jgi:transposase
MMGTHAAPDQLFYDFCLEDHFPSDHLLRQFNCFLDLSDIHRKLVPIQCSIGRPSIDPDPKRR